MNEDRSEDSASKPLPSSHDAIGQRVGLAQPTTPKMQNRLFPSVLSHTHGSTFTPRTHTRAASPSNRFFFFLRGRSGTGLCVEYTHSSCRERAARENTPTRERKNYYKLRCRASQKRQRDSEARVGTAHDKIAVCAHGESWARVAPGWQLPRAAASRMEHHLHSTASFRRASARPCAFLPCVDRSGWWPHRPGWLRSAHAPPWLSPPAPRASGTSKCPW